MRHQPDGAEHDFDAVIGAARARESWALEHLYTALAPAVAGFFRLQRAAEPEDLTSEVFAGVLRNIPTFRGDESHFRSWVFTIAYRRLADERRAASRRPHVRPLDGVLEPVDAADVEADVARLLATRRVRELCATLPPAQRDVLLLRLVGRMTVDEVAALMERSRGAIKALQRRGLATVTAVVDARGVPL
ncbi:MAG TPA: sigma-70 family RNA polymerase sigma factor [Acidimicrobiales bacterium]|nr:sigma-70 family RNA polymerase sigma factor [Acidimicrobiales bacterium]